MNPEPQPLKRRRRWWWRWTRRLFFLGSFAILVAAGLSYWAWQERVMVLNSLLLRLGGDLRVHFNAVDWKNGVLELKEASVTHVPTTERLVEAGRIDWKPDWQQLRGRNLGSIKIEGGSVNLPMSMFPKAAGGKDSRAASSLWRLDSLDLASTKVVLRDENQTPLLTATAQASLRGATSSATFDSADIKVADVTWQGKTVLSSLQVEAEMKDGRTVIKKGSLRDGQMNLAWIREISPALSEKLPPLNGSFQFEWQGQNMAFARDGLSAGGTHEVRLKAPNLQPRNGAGFVRAEGLGGRLWQDANRVWHVERGVLVKPEVEWTRELEDALLPKEKSSSQSSPWKLLVEAFEVKEGAVKLSATERCPVAGEFRWDTKLEAVEFSPEGARSSARQKLTVTDLSLRSGRIDPGQKPRPFLTFKSGVLDAVPDKLREKWFVEALTLEDIHLEFTAENGPWFETAATKPEPPPPPNPEPSWWQKLEFGNLVVSDASFEMAIKLAERMETSMRFDIVTANKQQHLTITDASLRVPTRANLPVLGVEKVEAVTALPELWRTRHFESINLAGGHVDAGDALISLFSGGKGAKVEEKIKATSARWTAGKIDVERLGVTLVNIAPGLPPVRFDVGFHANETPLDLDGLAENVEPQRIVLTRLRIPSPYEPLRTVAEMDVIHVIYTLDSLLHRRIDRVEIVSPLLYVGEDLFWYVENYRKYMKGENEVPDPTFGPPRPPKPRAPGWHVDTLAVSDGRLVLAPKGVPLKGFGKPFPFSFTSRLESGQLEADFEIPSDDYTLEEFKLEFRGMKGRVQFNLPMKDRNNNLTETFTVEQLRWKDLHIEKAHMSVTYDAHGIYGLFGGAAYDGYVNGAFDIYLDEVFTWDGWISGTGVNMTPITTTMFPRYFLLNGAVEGKVIATGNKEELYQADLELKNRTRGKFSIAALNDMIEALPKSLSGTIGDQLTRIGLETLRDFEYDRVDSKARFYGREGRGHLRFTGPHGARNFDVNVYDHRWKEEPRKRRSNETVARP